MKKTTKVIKKDGRIKEFNENKIIDALNGAILDSEYVITSKELMDIRLSILSKILLLNREIITTSEIDNVVIEVLREKKYNTIMKTYKKVAKKRIKNREKESDLMKNIGRLGIMTDRDNANVGNNFSSKMLRIASESNKTYILNNITEKIAQAHENGDVYQHDLDSYNLTINCLHIPTKKILKRGFNTGYGTINPPKRIETASELSCILLQSSQNDMFGGQSHPNFDNDMSIYVDLSRKEIQKDIKELIQNYETEEFINKIVEEKLEKKIRQAMQGVIYNLNTMHSRAGSQVPFSSINIGIPENEDAALVCQLFLEEYNKGLGKGEQPIFPNIIFRVKKGINAKKKDKYYYLFELACEVAAKRMNPTFMNLDADFNKEYFDKGFLPATMGCRTYIMKNVNGEPGCEGRGNIAPATINLPRIGILAEKNIETFMQLFEEKIELAKDSLLLRYDMLKKLKVKDLPFVAGQELIKGSEGLSQEDSIEPILKQGTWGIGFIGLAETLIALTGKHHGEDNEAKKLGIKIITFLRNKCDEFSEKYKLNFSCYATPAEGLSGKFILQDKMLFGTIEGVTDKEYYTNSFHIPVNYKISIIDKIQTEAPYHKLCNGGHISYIEVDNYPDKNTIKTIIEYAYSNTNISYLGINFHIRYCKDCGTTLNSNHTKCSKCGGHNIQGISRVTGYLSLDERFGVGKKAERLDRMSHNGTGKNNYI